MVDWKTIHPFPRFLLLNLSEQPELKPRHRFDKEASAGGSKVKVDVAH